MKSFSELTKDQTPEQRARIAAVKMHAESEHGLAEILMDDTFTPNGDLVTIGLVSRAGEREILLHVAAAAAGTATIIMDDRMASRIVTALLSGSTRLTEEWRLTAALELLRPLYQEEQW